MAGSDEDVRIFGVKAVFAEEETGVEGLPRSLDLELFWSPLIPSLAGVLRSEAAEGEARGEVAL